MVYLNHAATSYPKLPKVKAAVSEYLEELPLAQFRSTASENTFLEERCKQKLGNLFCIEDYEQIVFTSGATEAANLLIQGLPLKGKTILVTSNEHNAILRPLSHYQEEIVVKRISCNLFGEIKLQELEEEMEQGASVLFVNHCSNVTGMIADMETIGALCKKYGVYLIVDVSQSAGCIPVDMKKWEANGLIFTAHKSLLGIEGLGGFYFKEMSILKPVKFGGTGKAEDTIEFEVGTKNGPAIAALYAALEVLAEITVEKIQKQEEEMMGYLLEELKRLKGITIYGKEGGKRGPVLSFTAEKLSPSDVGYILEKGYYVITRTGFHCAPLIHEDMETKKEGTVRISISFLTKWEELKQFVMAMQEIFDTGTV